MDIQNIISTIVLIISRCLGIFSAYFFYKLLCNIASKRKGLYFTIPIFLSCAILCNMIIFANDFFNITIELLWFILMMLAGFKGRIIAKFSTVAIFFPLIVSLNFLIMEVLGYLHVQSGRGFLIGELCSILDSGLHLLIWYCLYKVFTDRVRLMSRLFDNRTWALLGIICLASLVSITTFIYWAPKESYKIWLGALACIVTNLGALYLAGYFVDNIQRDMEQKHLKLQKDYYEELEQNQTQIRRFRHDMNNHLSTIKSLFEDGDMTGASAYFAAIESQVAARSRVFCKNGIMNAVLNAKYNLAVSKDIDCFFHIDLPEVIAIDPVSLCSIFANTLDNAIEACVKIPNSHERFISVKARVSEQGYFSYEIENAKANDIVKRKGRYLSDKEEKQFHGLGLLSVKETVEKYEGMIDISYTEDIFRIVILIQNV